MSIHRLAFVRPGGRALALALMAAAAPPVSSHHAWAQTGDPCGALYGVDSSTDGLSIVDLDARSVTSVGPVGTEVPIAIATRPSDGRLFVWDNAVKSLMTVEACNGLGTPLDPANPNESVLIYDLVFTPEGRLFGMGPHPYELDPETGQVHGMGLFRDQDGNALDLVPAAAYAPDGRLFAIADSSVVFAPSDLGLLDPYTGAFTFLVRLDLPDTDVPQDLFFDPDGTLYLVVLRPFQFEQMMVFRVDPALGTTQEVWRSYYFPQSVAYAPACGVPIDACLQRATDIVLDYSNPIGRGSAVIDWTTVGESDIQGFNVVSIDDLGVRTQMNLALLPCVECVTGVSHTYSFLVPKHRGNKSIFIETVRLDGKIETYGPAKRR